jgi:hypothetical protein
VPAYRFWREYFRGALAEAGHECLEALDCDWAEGLLSLDRQDAAAWRERTWQKAVDFLRYTHARAPVDFILGYLFPRQIEPAALAEVRALGIPCVNFFCDNVREFRRVPDEYRSFDLHWVPEHKAVALYRAARLPCLHAPMACWVPPERRVSVTRETLPATFVGTRDEQRAALFAAAIKLGLQVELRGVGWGADAPVNPGPPSTGNLAKLIGRQLTFVRQHGWRALARRIAGGWQPLAPAFDFSVNARPSPEGDAYWDVLRESAVCLGVNRYPSLRFPFDRPDSYSRMRDIEAPMVGACYLTEWTEGLDDLYELGTEIEIYRDAAELVEKARALVADPPRRIRLRTAGQLRSLRDHSIPRTIERIAERLGISMTQVAGTRK